MTDSQAKPTTEETASGPVDEKIKYAKGKLMTREELEALPAGSLVWYLYQEHGSPNLRLNGPVRVSPTPETGEGTFIGYQGFGAVEFDVSSMEKTAVLKWEDSDGQQSIHHLAPKKKKESKAEFFARARAEGRPVRVTLTMSFQHLTAAERDASSISIGDIVVRDGTLSVEDGAAILAILRKVAPENAVLDK